MRTFRIFLRKLSVSLIRVLRVLRAIGLVVAVGVAYAHYVEPHWLCVRRLTLSASPTVRVIHITDIHFDGDTRHLERVVRTINRLDADLVCFTGDLVEDAAHLNDALRILATVNKPLYGIPGNHDHWARLPFDEVRRTFRGTGGDWLMDTSAVMRSKQVALLTAAVPEQETPPGHKRILLEHYPDNAGTESGVRFDLILAGHTHGGQVRIPLINRFLLPFELDRYDRGLFQTSIGPLYVNPGIGTYFWKVRFLCRPEITVIGI